MQLDFGEVADHKGVLLVRATAGRPAAVEELHLESGRRLVDISGRLDDVLARAAEIGPSDFVRVTLHESARVGLADEVRAAIPNAVEVLLEGPRATAERPEPRQSLEPAEAFSRYLSDRGHADERVEALFSELLDEVSG